MTKRPSGFFTSEAVFARNLLYETPADAVNLVSVTIRFLISLAIKVAEGLCFLFSVTFRYASSNDRGSTKSVYSKKMARICRETSLYLSIRGGTKINPGHCRKAVTEAMAECTPNRR